MATEKQIAANRANALKSTGPRTPEGKMISANNGRPQIRLANTIPMKGESSDLFSQHVGRLIVSHAPGDDNQIEIIHRLAVAGWRQMRLWSIESASLSAEVEAQIAADPELATKDPLIQAAAAYRSLSKTQTQFKTDLYREESHLDRSYYRALGELRRAKKEKTRTQSETSGGAVN